MPESYLPTREADFLAWSNNFSALINSTPTDYGLTAAQATAYDGLNSAFANAYAVTQGPNRGPTATQIKKDARAALTTAARDLVSIIQHYPETTNAMRVDLRITVPNPEPTPVPPPNEAPEMDIMSVIGRTVKIRIHNDKTLERRKPLGVKGAAIFSYVGATPPDDLEAWQFQGNTTQTVIDVEFPSSVAAGSQVWLTAFWFNPRAQSGPPCQPSSVYLAGGLQKAA